MAWRGLDLCRLGRFARLLSHRQSFLQALWPWRPNRWWSRLTARGITFLCVVVAWVVFRAHSLNGALAVLNSMRNLPNALDGRLGPAQAILETLGFGFQGGQLAFHHIELMGYLLIWILAIGGLPNTQQIFREFKPVLDGARPVEAETAPWLARFVWHPSAVSGAVIGVLTVLGILGLSAATEFLYFQF